MVFSVPARTAGMRFPTLLTAALTARFKEHIRDVPDFPKPGIVFKDITPLLKDQEAFRAAVDHIVERHRDSEIGRAHV